MRKPTQKTKIALLAQVIRDRMTGQTEIDISTLDYNSIGSGGLNRAVCQAGFGMRYRNGSNPAYLIIRS
jgi:hypothetical protein